MIEQEQILCFKCKSPYSQQNIPRLLTMCGHTFCEKCIKQSMIKKVAHNKFKIICPLDKISTDTNNSNASSLPRNLSLLQLAKKVNQNHIQPVNAADNQSKQMPQEPDEKHKTLKSLLFSHSNSNENQTCLLHIKPLQLVCVRDCIRICSSCAIFGQHKGHIVKTTKQVDQQSVKLLSKLKQIQKTYNSLYQKLQSKQMSVKLQTLLQKKKQQLERQVIRHFKQLHEIISQSQKRILIKLDKKITEYKAKIKESLTQKVQSKNYYKEWDASVKQKINQLSKQRKVQSQQQIYKLVFRSENFIEISEKNSQAFKQMSNSFIQQTQKLLSNISAHFDLQPLKKKIKQSCKIQDNNHVNTENQPLDSSIINLAKNIDEQSLLDDISEGQPLNRSAIKISQTQRQRAQHQVDNTLRSTNKQIKRNISNSNIYIRPLQKEEKPENRTKSTHKQRLSTTPGRKNSIAKSQKLLSLGSKSFSILKDIRTLSIPQKFQNKIEGIIKGQSDVLDLTNGELGNQKVLHIMQNIKDCNVTITKLVRNKLNDQFFEKSIPLLSKTVMLNLSRNQLTQKTMQGLIKARKQGSLPSLKSLMIGQNKITQRNNKEAIQQLKKLGVNVCI